MRVLMLVSEAPPIKSGIARVAGELTKGLTQYGFEIDTLSANEVKRLSFKEFRISSLGLKWPTIQAKLDQYDIIHVHGAVPSFSDIGLLLGRIGGRVARRNSALVYTHHCDIDIEGLDGPVGLYNSFHRKLIGLADHVVASTPTYAMQLEEFIEPGRLSAVRFGVRADEFYAPINKPSRLNVLFVGQLRPYKGVNVLLRAWSKVEHADLHIVGEGHERANLEALAGELNLRSVHFHGQVTDEQLREFYAQAHAVVLPSTRKAEAFGLVLLEGMALGCVPVASDLPGVSDVVGTTGFTFPIGDSDALARILLDLRDDPDIIEKSERAIGRAISSDWNYTINAYAGIYKQARLGRLLEAANISRSRSPRALQHWLSNVMKHVGVDRASLMLVQPEGGALRIAAGVGIEPDVVAATRQPIGAGIAGFVAQTRKPIRIDGLKMPVVARFHKSQPRLSSSLILPIHHHGRTVGVLNLARGNDRLPFTGTDEHWLHALAVQVAPILATYRLQNYASLAGLPGEKSLAVRYTHRPSGPPAPAADTAYQPAVVMGSQPVIASTRAASAMKGNSTEKAVEVQTTVPSEGQRAGVLTTAALVAHNLGVPQSTGQWSE